MSHNAFELTVYYVLPVAPLAEQAAEMSRELYRSGLKDFLTVLDSERTLLSVQNNLVQSDATVDTDLIQLYKALGGGWN